MKKIINRKTGKLLTIEEAKALCHKLSREIGITYADHKTVSGYPTPELAEKANLRAVCETYEGYIFAYTGTVYDTFEGHKVYVLAIKNLPSDFEQRYPDFVVIG